MGMDQQTIQSRLQNLKGIGDAILEGDDCNDLYQQLSAWMIESHCQFSSSVTVAEGNRGDSFETQAAVRYVDSKEERSHFQITLPQNPIIFADSPEKFKPTKAQRGLYLHIKNAMTFLVLAREHLNKVEPDKQKASRRKQLLSVWENCVLSIPSGRDQDYPEEMRTYSRDFVTARESVGYTRNRFVKRRNEEIPHFLLGGNGQTPALRFVRQNGTELGRVDPITDDGVMPHNQNHRSPFPPFARRTCFLGLEVFGLSSKSRFHAKGANAQRKETSSYYQKAIRAANTDFGVVKANLLVDLTGSEFYRGPEARGRKRRQEVQEKDPNAAPVAVAAMPFVELFPGKTVPLKSIRRFDDLWSHPVLALLKKEVWDRSEDTDKEVLRPVLQHFTNAVSLWQGHGASEKPRRAAIYDEVKALAEMAHDSAQSELAAFLLMLLRYHFQEHDYWRFFDAQMTGNQIPSRFSKAYTLKTAAKWMGIVGGVALVGAAIGGYQLLLMVFLIVVPIVLLTVGVLLGLAKAAPKPPALANDSDDPVSHFYTALITLGRHSAVCLALLSRVLAKKGLRHWAHCKSAKDRFSRYMLITFYVDLCLKIKEKGASASEEELGDMKYQMAWFAHVIKYQLTFYAGVDGIMETTSPDDRLLVELGIDSPYRGLFECYANEEEALESAVGDRRIGASARNWVP